MKNIQLIRSNQSREEVKETDSLKIINYDLLLLIVCESFENKLKISLIIKDILILYSF
jgi:hypothetical protein